MACCSTVIGGSVNVSIQIPGGERIKLTTEGSLTVKQKTKTISDRDQGLGHTSSRNNSYIEGTFILTRGLFSSEDLFPATNGDPTAAIFNDDITGLGKILCQCGLSVSLETECGDTWLMTSAAETSDGTQDISEGTASFRFSSPFPIQEINANGFSTSLIGRSSGPSNTANFTQ